MVSSATQWWLILARGVKSSGAWSKRISPNTSIQPLEQVIFRFVDKDLNPKNSIPLWNKVELVLSLNMEEWKNGSKMV